MKILDLHCDALSYPKGCLEGEVTVAKMQRGNALGQCFAIFAPWGRLRARGESPYDFYRKKKREYEQMLLKNRKTLASALSPKDVVKNQREGKISTILTVEGGDFLEGRLSRLEQARQDGVRMITLTWNDPNELGFPNSADEKRDALPLTPFGCEALERMQALGILADLSHLNRGGFFQAASLCRRPFVCSHSCCDALCPHPRNLTDAQLRVLGETGSVVGLNFYSCFLRKDAPLSRLEDLVEHAVHMVKTAGEEALALGSDFDGRDTPLEFGDWEGMPLVAEALLRRFSYRQTEKICFGNALRLWREAGESVGDFGH